MKKIISGKMYNTETAEVIDSWDNGLGYNDFNNIDETLYKKKTGEFFIEGNGGAATKYSVHSGNTSSGSSNIIPLTEDEVKEWLEEHSTAEKYEKLFGIVSE